MSSVTNYQDLQARYATLKEGQAGVKGFYNAVEQRLFWNSVSKETMELIGFGIFAAVVITSLGLYGMVDQCQNDINNVALFVTAEIVTVAGLFALGFGISCLVAAIRHQNAHKQDKGNKELERMMHEANQAVEKWAQHFESQASETRTLLAELPEDWKGAAAILDGKSTSSYSLRGIREKFYYCSESGQRDYLAMKIATSALFILGLIGVVLLATNASDGAMITGTLFVTASVVGVPPFLVNIADIYRERMFIKKDQEEGNKELKLLLKQAEKEAASNERIAQNYRNGLRIMSGELENFSN